MFLKRDVCTDILSLIAHGTQTAVHNALKLLLHYWPPSSEISHNVSPYGVVSECSVCCSAQASWVPQTLPPSLPRMPLCHPQISC
jgi:hypothetical protein